MTIVLKFDKHDPVRFEGSAFECTLQIVNAGLFPGYLSYEVLPEATNGTERH